MYARNTNVRPHSRLRATVGRLTLVPGGWLSDHQMTQRITAVAVCRTPGFSELSSLPERAARSGTNGAHPNVRCQHL